MTTFFFIDLWWSDRQQKTCECTHTRGFPFRKVRTLHYQSLQPRSRSPAVLLSPLDLFSRLTLTLASFSLVLDYNDSNHRWRCSMSRTLSSRSLNWSSEECDLTPSQSNKPTLKSFITDPTSWCMVACQWHGGPWRLKRILKS